MVQVLDLTAHGPAPYPSAASGGGKFPYGGGRFLRRGGRVCVGEALGVDTSLAQPEWDGCPARTQRQVDDRRACSAFGGRGSRGPGAPPPGRERPEPLDEGGGSPRTRPRGAPRA